MFYRITIFKQSVTKKVIGYPTACYLNALSPFFDRVTFCTKYYSHGSYSSISDQGIYGGYLEQLQSQTFTESDY